MFHRLATSLARRGATMVVAALVVSCGGGVDSGGTGAPPTSFASGAITGFGSVIVTGVHFDDRSASIRDADGNALSRDDLRLGMTVDALGSAIVPDADGNDASTATSIVVRSEMIGPVAASNVAARTLTILGQTVDIANTTVFDDALVNGQSSLSAGDIVVVYANLDPASGHYAATRIESRAAVGFFAEAGIVANLDPSARTFAIGGTRISYAGLGAAGVPATLSNGSFIRVTLATAASAGGVWTALAIGGPPVLDDRDEAKLDGLVSSFTSMNQFSVGGTPVDARAAQFSDVTSGIGVGTRVEVEGATRAGVLVATRVRVVTDSEESGQQFDVRGPLASLDTTAKTFVVRNVIVSYAGTVDFRDGTAADLVSGLDVEARGMLSADGTRLLATRIDLRH